VTASARFGKRDVEEAVVAYLLTDEFQTSLAGNAASHFGLGVSSDLGEPGRETIEREAVRPGVCPEAARVHQRVLQTAEMVPVREFLRMVASESPQRLAVLLYNGDTV